MFESENTDKCDEGGDPDDFDAEIESVRQNRELLRLLDRRSLDRKTYPLSEARHLLQPE